MQRLILEFAVRAALIGMSTAAVLRLLRVKSAGARHAAWAGVLVLMLLLPAWTAWGPRASLPVLPAATVAVASSTTMVSTIAPQWSFEGSPHAIEPAPQAFIWRSWMTLAGIYLAGVLVLLMRLAMGTWRARALVVQAVRYDGRLTSGSCAAPVTVGWLRPSVILPETWRTWPQQQLDAVLTHEGEHVRRRDPLVQWVALLNRAIFWFHPLAWWLERTLSALAEEACDAAVLERGCNPLDYSCYLLEMARSIEQMGMRVNSIGMAMPGSSLPQRIRQIVGRGPAPRLTRARTLCLASVCVMVSGIFAAATMDRRQSPPEPPAPPAAPAPPAPPAFAATAAAAPLPPLPPVSPAPPSFALTDAPVPLAPQAPAPRMPPPPPPVALMDAPAPLTPQTPTPRMPPPPPVALMDAPAPLTPQTPAPRMPPPPPPAPPQKDRLIVFYFDLRGMPTDAQARAIAAAIEFGPRQIASGGLVAVMSWDGGRLRILQDFTSDRNRLVNVLQHLPVDSRGAVDAGQQVDGLRSAAEMLGKLPNKKNLVYFASQIRSDPAQLQPAIDAAVRGDVAFFPIDVAAPYRLAAEDVISVSMGDDARFGGTYTIRPDGMISIPLLGDVRAAGLTVKEMESAINSRALRLIKTPRSAVNVLTQHGK
jgi:beta-lactamase regulating signal transducer with metallopeptidase domain